MTRLVCLGLMLGALAAEAQSRAHPHGELWKRVQVGGRPFSVAIDKTGAAWVGVLDLNKVVRIDPGTGAVTAEVKSGNVPSALCSSKDGGLIWVSNQFGRTIQEIDVATARVRRTAAVPGSAGVCTAGPAGKLFVALLNGPVLEIDLETFKVARTLGRFAEPNGLLLAPGERGLYVSEASGSGVALVDLETSKVTARFGGLKRSQGLALTQDATQLWVADEIGRVFRFDTRTHEALAQAPAPTGFALAASPDDRVLYLSQALAGKVSVLEAKVFNEVATLQVGGTPRRVAFTSDGSVAVIANEGGWVDLVR